MPRPHVSTSSSNLEKNRRVTAAHHAIEKAIGDQPRVVTVSDLDGKVILRGWVPLLRDARRLENCVAAAIGRDNLVSCLLVGPPGGRSDPDVEKSIVDLFMEDRSLDPTSIAVSVNDGAARLTGFAANPLRVRFAAALCWWIPGVRAVQNELRPIAEEPVDDELTAAIVGEVMEKDPLVDRIEILILNKGGRITLSGTVAGEVARDAAENDAWSVEGVCDVVNDIELAPPLAA